MRYNQLGRTGLFVSEICLGAATFGTAGSFWSTFAGVEQDGVDQIVRRSLDAGVNFIDTADIYSFGASEIALGRSLQNLGVARGDVVISTKVGGEAGPGPNARGASRTHIMNSIGKSLERLQTDYVDVYLIHSNDPVTPIDETLRALDDVVSQGMARYVGVSNWAAWKMAKALGRSELKGWVDLDVVQAYYSLAGRELEREIVPFLEEEKLALMVWSPMAGGLLSGKYRPDAPNPGQSRRTAFDFPPVDKERVWPIIDVMREIGDAHGASVAEVALGWVISRPFVTSTLIGARNLEQLDTNLRALDLVLTEEDLARLDKISRLTSEYPRWEQGPGADRRPKPFIPASKA